MNWKTLLPVAITLGSALAALASMVLMKAVMLQIWRWSMPRPAS